MTAEREAMTLPDVRDEMRRMRYSEHCVVPRDTVQKWIDAIDDNLARAAEPVAWAVWGAGWELFHTEYETKTLASTLTNPIIKPLYTRPPEPARDANWYSRVPVDSRFTVSLMDGSLVQDEDGPWVLRSAVDAAMQVNPDARELDGGPHDR